MLIVKSITTIESERKCSPTTPEVFYSIEINKFQFQQIFLDFRNLFGTLFVVNHRIPRNGAQIQK